MQQFSHLPAIKIDPAAILGFAAAVLLIPLPWLLSWCLVVGIHELCHYIVILLTRGQVFELRFGIDGISMVSETTTWAREVLCAAAGPVSGFLLVLLAPWMPRVALCGWMLSLYNLLPLFPLDGGRILSGVLYMALPEHVESIMHMITLIVLLLLCAICLYAAVWLGMGLMPIFFAAGLVLRVKKIKTPCKDGRLRVQ